MISLDRKAVILILIGVCSSILSYSMVTEATAAPTAIGSESLLSQGRGRLPPPRTSRSGLCLIGPGLLEENFVIWSDRPLFLWHAAADDSQIRMQQLRLLDNNINPNYQKLLWETSLSEDAQFVSYTGTPLQPNQVYNWELVFQRRDPSTDQWEEVTLRSAFQVMDVDARSQIATELQTLTAQWQKADVDGETIANQQANYFEEKQLWSDALQALYSVKDPSPAMQQRQQMLINHICGPGATAGA